MAKKKTTKKKVKRYQLPESLTELADKCLPKHVQVVQAILSGDYSSNAQAYRAFYPKVSLNSSKAACARMLAIANVGELFNALKDFHFMQGVLSRAEAMDILSNMARTSLSDLVELVSVDAGDGVEYSTWRFKSSAELTKGELAAIQELSSTKEGNKIKVHDQKAAIKQLAEMLGWNEASKVDVNHSGLDVNIYLPDNGRDNVDG